jgi:hypothetical protein
VVQATAFVTQPVKEKKSKNLKAKKKESKPDASKKEERKPSKPCPLCMDPKNLHWKHECPDRDVYEAALQKIRDDGNKKPARTYVSTVGEEDSALVLRTQF